MQSTEFPPGPEEIPALGLEYSASQRDLTPQPDTNLSNYKPAKKLTGKVALITGGDAGIGRAVAIAYALATDDSRFVTGALLDVTGGQLSSAD